jgi:hypothetical protein
MRRLLTIAVALAGLAGPALAGDADYQEGSASRDYGYVGYPAGHGYGGYGGYDRGYGYGFGLGFGYGGGYARDYGYGPSGYPPPAYPTGYGYGGHGGYGYAGYGNGYAPYGYAGYGNGYAPYGYAYGRGSWGGRRAWRRHRCGCYYYDDDYR